MRGTLLFDIDGTLISAGGIGRLALEDAFAELYGWPQALDGVICDGQTDPLIVAEVFANHGHPDTGFEAIIEAYLPALRRRAEEARGGRILPGVLELLEALDALPGLELGLLTGNVEMGARIKLERFDLWERFAFGAYGSDARLRADLVPIARARSRDAAAPALILGDTPNDILAARAHGLPTLAVGTGSSTALAELEAAAPEALLPDLADTEAVLETIARLLARP